MLRPSYLKQHQTLLGRNLSFIYCVALQPFGNLEEVSKLKERKVVGYKCKFCVEVHPTLRAICNHLRKHVQYGNGSAVSAAVKVRKLKSELVQELKVQLPVGEGEWAIFFVF